MKTTNVTSHDALSYERGVKLAKSWIGASGDLNADGPETKDEAFYNGFIDTLAAERRGREAPGLTVKTCCRCGSEAPIGATSCRVCLCATFTGPHVETAGSSPQ